MLTVTLPMSADLDETRWTLRGELNRRAKIRAMNAALDGRLAHTDLMPGQPHIRAAEREAGSETRKLPVTARAAMSTAEKSAKREIAAARLRDALNYSLTGEELFARCAAAAQTCTRKRSSIPADDLPDVTQSLALEVIRRHGASPMRERLPMGWLRTRARAIWIDLERQRERATGRHAAHDELRDWQRADKREARAAAMAAGDPIWQIAANLPAPNPQRDADSAAAIAERVPGLTFLQRDALRVAIGSRKRPLTNLQRQHWHVARRVLRQRFPTPDMARAAMRDPSYAAALLVDAAIRVERQRAAGAARGSGLPGSRDMSGRMPARIKPTRTLTTRLGRKILKPSNPAPRKMIGPDTWSGYGNGYSGACSIAGALRRWQRAQR